MDLQTIEKIVSSVPKGANIVLEWTRPAKTKKNSPTIFKSVRMVGRIGIQYDNIQSVQEKRENGDLPKENAGLPSWAEWMKFPFFIRHKEKGTVYLRMYKGTSEKIHPKVAFIMGNESHDKKEVESFLLSSEKRDNSESDVFIVKIDDLVSVFGES